MALLDTLSNRKAMPMSGRATFGIQRPSLPPRRLEKVRPIVLNEMQQNPAPYEGEGFERLTGNSANADVNAEMPSGEQRGEIMENPRQGQGRSDAQDQTDSLFAQIAGLQNKDYGEKKRGGFKDILIALGMGALQGVANSDPRGGVGGMLGGAIGGAAAGGIGGAVDGSTDNRMRDRIKLDKLYGDYGQASKIADDELNREYKKTQIGINAVKPEIMQRDLERQIRRDAVKAQLDQDKLDFNIETATKLAVHRERKLDAEINNNKVKAALEQQKIDELIRNNKVKDENEDNRNDTSREKGRGRYATPLPPVTTPSTSQTSKTSEKSARAYLQTKGLKGNALENAIKTARANGEID